MKIVYNPLGNASLDANQIKQSDKDLVFDSPAKKIYAQNTVYEGTDEKVRINSYSKTDKLTLLLGAVNTTASSIYALDKLYWQSNTLFVNNSAVWTAGSHPTTLQGYGITDANLEIKWYDADNKRYV